jgi:hypothetical protein
MIPTNCIDKADEDEGDNGGGGGSGYDDDFDEDDRIAKCRTLFTMPNVRCLFRSAVSINNIYIFFGFVRSYLLM